MSEENRIRKAICEAGQRLSRQGMAAAHDGNISVRLSDDEILCTPTGIGKGELRPEEICRIDRRGHLLEAVGGLEPSCEIKMHLRIYEERPDVRAIVHAHPPFATVFAARRKPLDQPLLAETLISLGSVPVADYAAPSTQAAADAVAVYAKDFDAMLLANHGALSYGKDLREACYRMETLEFTASVTYRAMLLGKEAYLTPAEAAQIREAFPRQRPS